MPVKVLEQHPSASNAIRLCQGCELAVDIVEVAQGKSAYCPRCGTQLYRGGKPSLSGDLAIAVTCLLLFIPSHFFDFISIRLVGVMIPATLPSGVLALMDEGFSLIALLVLFCSSIAPFLVCSSVVTAHMALRFRWFSVLNYSLIIIHKLKPWVMIDVFLVSVAVSCFKLQDYSDIHIGVGLYGLVLLQLATVLLATRVSVRRYWEAWKPENQYTFEHKDVHCHHCHLSQPENHHCVRCEQKLYHRKPNSIQRTWAYLIAASIAIFPANLIPISILITNGQRLEDTIFSGVASLINSDMVGIAIIIFVASIVVPIIKIFGLTYLLLAIKFKRQVYHRQRMTIFFAIKWIGKWSVMDLFVISIMLTLVDRGQILDFTPGYGAVAFGMVVVLTMLAAESMDPRLIWDNYPDTSEKNELSNE
ncbi:paraquat-inducible protein A [Vibrio aestuarianus]|uniref:Paraquat-inducible protein A n=1 Tax=Vibrio aestuarianus TaxID=28171 RepID=A0AAX3U851_9VIBR|nr:paraquat-inducible protein A [Vibrio aestuarianus]KOE80840.1 paraquat-inducible protein A [Vibrio alginolyticus]MDE1213057.1 paraquat-inducible protein A [Vibrio aestuarianus]MDE1216959.1 paraquat-inducible protein A [Vibrio aestuarianus]MDE1232486.1 paraquat-inducible protein A [Vibrio aestuarianus]MDE1237366.1 paraquat-inducible protein A [Vibrio aestuarianus]